MATQEPRFEMCEREECRAQGRPTHGHVTFLDGSLSAPIWSREHGARFLRLVIDQTGTTLLTAAHASALEAAIRQSPLRAEGKYVAADVDLLLPFAALAALLGGHGGPVGVTLITFGWGQTQPDVRQRGFDIDMPEVCPAGCHRVRLYQDGTLVAEERVTTVDDTNALIDRWRKEYSIPRWQTRTIRRKAVATTRRYIAEFARRSRQ